MRSMKLHSSSKISHSSAIIYNVAELKKFKLTKELAIAQAEMNAVTKIEESELHLNDGNGGSILPGFITKDDLLQNYPVTQASSVAKDSPSTVEIGLRETENPLLPSTSFPIAQSHENNQLEPKIEDSNNPGIPVIN